jgi:hypothetical protein
LPGLIEIAVHHRSGRAADDLADLAARHFATLLVDQADLMAGRRLADRVQLVREFVRIEDAAAAALGHAVVLGQTARPAFENVRLELPPRTARWCRTSCGSLQVEAIELRQVHDALVLHRHQHRVRRAMRCASCRNFSASNFAISTTVPPIASVGKKLTSVVFEYSGVEQIVTAVRS